MILVRLLLLLTVISWGWSFVATKVCLSYMTPLEVIGLRYLIGLPVLLAILLAKRLRLRLTRRDFSMALLAAAAVTAHFLIQITGIKYTTATNTGWIIAVTPLALAVLSVVFLKERLGRNAVVGIAVASAGIVILVSRSRFTDLAWLSSVGDWLVFASAHTWAVYTVLTRNISRRYDPLLTTFVILALSSIGIVGTMLATSDMRRFTRLPPEPLLAILFLGIICLALAFWVWQEGVARLGAARTGFFLYLEPLATTALAVPYLGEPFGIPTAIGGLLVLAGVCIAEKRHKSTGELAPLPE
ncbi:MAG TPA: DMT family transporter [Candidatus Deferrimicrobium sp.]|nr:DMT family transporter [Candidatus Deferrimicrobium sp.]